MMMFWYAILSRVSFIYLSFLYGKVETEVKVDVEVEVDWKNQVKVEACGVCGTDLHYHKGEFLAKVSFFTCLLYIRIV
jgi:hypothetical protein